MSTQTQISSLLIVNVQKDFFPGGKVVISPQSTNVYFDFYYFRKNTKYLCKFDETAYDCWIQNDP